MSTKKASTGGERLEVHGFRALAALTVMTFHTYQNNRGAPDWHWPLEGTVWHEVMLATDLCVDLFFVLSGLLLALPYARTCLGEAPPRSGRALLLRRATRLLPLYFIVVCLVWTITNPELPGNWKDLLLHLTFTQVYSQEYIFYTDGPAWSLANEMHYYILLAILGALAQKACRRLRTRGSRMTLLVSGVSALILISIVYKVVAAEVYDVPADHWPTWYGPLAKLDVFCTGILLAVLYTAGMRLRSVPAQLLTLLAAGGIFAAGLAMREPYTPEPFLHPIFALGSAFVLAATSMGTRWTPGWVKWRPLVSLSMASYSIYLWHEPIMRYLRYLGLLPERGDPLSFPVTAIALFLTAVPVALLSYRWIELTGQKLIKAFDSKGAARDYYEGTPGENDPPRPPPRATRPAEHATVGSQGPGPHSY